MNAQSTIWRVYIPIIRDTDKNWQIPKFYFVVLNSVNLDFFNVIHLVFKQFIQTYILFICVSNNSLILSIKKTQSVIIGISYNTFVKFECVIMEKTLSLRYSWLLRAIFNELPETADHNQLAKVAEDLKEIGIIFCIHYSPGLFCRTICYWEIIIDIVVDLLF